MDPTRTVGATEWTQDAGQTNGGADRRMDRRSETSITPLPNNFVVWGYNDKIKVGSALTNDTPHLALTGELWCVLPAS